MLDLPPGGCEMTVDALPPVTDCSYFGSNACADECRVFAALGPLFSLCSRYEFSLCSRYECASIGLSLLIEKNCFLPLGRCCWVGCCGPLAIGQFFVDMGWYFLVWWCSSAGGWWFSSAEGWWCFSAEG